MTIKNIYNKHTEYRNKYFINTNNLLGFWIYLMSDCIIFGTIFAVYFIFVRTVPINFIIENNLNLTKVLIETIILLFSSIFSSMFFLCMKQLKIILMRVCLLSTFVLGCIFVVMEFKELYYLYMHNYGPDKNSFFSVYFTLLGIHGVHILAGLVWMILIFFQSFYVLTNRMKTNYFCFGLFWHFIDIIWICIFNFVYLLGVIA